MENLGAEAADVANIANKGGKSLGGKKNRGKKGNWMNCFEKNGQKLFFFLVKSFFFICSLSKLIILAQISSFLPFQETFQ